MNLLAYNRAVEWADSKLVDEHDGIPRGNKQWLGLAMTLARLELL